MALSSREAFHCFSNVNSVLSNTRQLRHQTAIQSRLDVIFSEFSFSAVCSVFLLTHGESTPFAPFNFMLSKALSTSYVSASNVISSFSTSILIVRFKIFSFFSSCAPNPVWPVCFTSTRFSRTFQKVCNCFCRATTQKSSPWHNFLRSPSQLQKKAGHVVPTLMDLFWNTSDHVFLQIHAASSVPYMFLQSSGNLPFCSCSPGSNV